jgi:hypothetical protein
MEQKKINNNALSFFQNKITIQKRTYNQMLSSNKLLPDNNRRIVIKPKFKYDENCELNIN